MTTNLYDQVPYVGTSYPRTHPNRLATIGRIFGMNPAPVEKCRVLEIGCGQGANLVPMAAFLPGSIFVGIDSSERQIAAARELARSLDLKNIFLDPLDVRGIPADAGPFDYIIVHNLFSFVPTPAQDAIFEVCRHNLATQGIAHVNYSTYPGWHGRAVLRDFLRYHATQGPDSSHRVERARTLLTMLVETTAGERGAPARLIRDEHRRLGPNPDGNFLHEELAACHQPVFFHEFMARASAQQLQFLGEAAGRPLEPATLTREIKAALDRWANDDLLVRQQYLDILINRTERETLLCRQEVPLRREIRNDDLDGFQISLSSEDSIAAEELSLGPLATEAVKFLAEQGPLTFNMAELESAARSRLAPEIAIKEAAKFHEEGRKLRADLWRAYAKGVIDLHVQPHGPARLSERPEAPAWLRFLAQRGNEVTNVRHEPVKLDEMASWLLPLLDGSNNRQTLNELLHERVRERGMIVQRQGRSIKEAAEIAELLSQALEAKLAELAQQGLLFAASRERQRPE